MNKIRKTTLAIAALAIALPLAAMARGGEDGSMFGGHKGHGMGEMGHMGGMGPMGGMGGMRGMGPDFAELDANGDGKVTAEEFAAHKAKRFAEVDADGDGKVTAAEVEAHMTARMAEEVARRARVMVAFADDNGDGVLSADELGREGGPEDMIAALDTDGDGAVSLEEIEAHRKDRPRHDKP